MHGMHITSGSPEVEERVVSIYMRLKQSCPGQAKYVTLYRAVLETIRQVGPGHRLPPAGHLATPIGVSRWTVTTAYGRLAAQGYLRMVRRWGALINDMEHWPRAAEPFGRSWSQAESVAEWNS